MEKIKVSGEFRMMQTNCNFTMKFNATADMEKAYKAIESAINEINSSDYYKDYKDLWLQDLNDCCDKNEFSIESTLCSEAFTEYIPVMCEAVAKAIPEIGFEGQASYDDLRCYDVRDFLFRYTYGILWISLREVNDDCGYFCPNCGEWIATIDTTFDEDEIRCFDCDEVIKVSDLKKVDAFTFDREIEII